MAMLKSRVHFQLVDSFYETQPILLLSRMVAMIIASRSESSLALLFQMLVSCSRLGTHKVLARVPLMLTSKA